MIWHHLLRYSMTINAKYRFCEILPVSSFLVSALQNLKMYTCARIASSQVQQRHFPCHSILHIYSNKLFIRIEPMIFRCWNQINQLNMVFSGSIRFSGLFTGDEMCINIIYDGGGAHSGLSVDEKKKKLLRRLDQAEFKNYSDSLYYNHAR